MEWKYIFLIVLALCSFFVVAAFLSGPIKLLFRLGRYLVVGTLLIAVVNLFSGHTGLHIALNPFTILTAGILQVPGTLMLVVMNYLFV